MSALQDKIDTMNPRERMLVFVAVLALLYVIVELAVFGPANSAIKKMSGQMTEVQSTLTTGQGELSTLLSQSQNNTNAPLMLQITRLQREIDAQQAELAALANGMVSADSLPQILEDVLVETGKLKLVQLTAQPVEELQLTATDDEGEPVSAGVYKHSVTLVLEGRYFDAVTYLQALEALPWSFNWDALHYQVEEFPTARIELQVYTLTTEEGLFGES